MEEDDTGEKVRGSTDTIADSGIKLIVYVGEDCGSVRETEMVGVIGGDGMCGRGQEREVEVVRVVGVGEREVVIKLVEVMEKLHWICVKSLDPTWFKPATENTT